MSDHPCKVLLKSGLSLNCILLGLNGLSGGTIKP